MDKELKGVFISKDLADRVYNELVCCRKLRERVLLDFKSKEPIRHYEEVIKSLDASIKYTERLYNILGDLINQEE